MKSISYTKYYSRRNKEEIPIIRGKIYPELHHMCDPPFPLQPNKGKISHFYSRKNQKYILTEIKNHAKRYSGRPCKFQLPCKI